MSVLRLIGNEFRHGCISYFRYLGNSLVSLAVLILFFYGMFLGARFMAGPDLSFGTRTTSLVIGFVAWTLVLGALSSLSSEITNSARAGVLEQIFLAPYPHLVVFLAKAVGGVLFVLGTNALVFLVVSLLTGVRPALPAAAAGPVAALLLGAYGLGFALGALALHLKVIDQIVNVVQFGLLFLVVAPVDEIAALGTLTPLLLPLVPAVGALRSLLAHEAGVSLADSAIALVNGTAYLLLGLAAFAASVRLAKHRGSLAGH